MTLWLPSGLLQSYPRDECLELELHGLGGP